MPRRRQQTGPAGPSLSEVLGSAAALPEATAPRRGRQHIRHAERQRADAMMRIAGLHEYRKRAPGPHDRPRCRCDRQLGRYPRAAMVAALSAARPPRPADRILAAADAVLVVGGARLRASLGDVADCRSSSHCSSSAPSSCAAPAAPGTTSPIAISTPGSSGRGRGRFRRDRSACRRPSAFLVVQALIGLAVLLQFNRFAVVTGIASLAIVAVYPFMKRITWWPQIVLGLAFSWGALMGFAVILGRIDAPALLLYAGSIAWVIGYDTIYAHQDTEDDALIGVKSTARLFGARTHRALMRVLWPGGGFDRRGAVVGRRGRWPAWIGLAAFAAHLVWQIARPEDRRSRAVPARLQIQPRCRAVAVCGTAGRCGMRAASDRHSGRRNAQCALAAMRKALMVAQSLR